MITKYFWAFRLLLLKPFLKHLGICSYMGKPLYLSNIGAVSIGNRVRIYPGIRIECLKESSLVIEDNCSIGQDLHLTVGNQVIIGEGTTISSHVLITDIDHEYRQIDVSIMQQPMIIKKTIIGKNCFIGAGAVILPGTVLGNQCVVGANAVVKGIFPDYSIIAGVPAKVIRNLRAPLAN